MATKSKLQPVEGAELMAVEGGHHHCHQGGDGGGSSPLGLFFRKALHGVVNFVLQFNIINQIAIGNSAPVIQVANAGNQAA
jgi:hypothetical protein